MEHAAQNQASKTRKCEQDCVHIDLSWARGETPEPRGNDGGGPQRACRAGHGQRQGAVLSPTMTRTTSHVHIVASKINPDTGRAYDLAGSWRKGSTWAEQYEREHGGVISTRREDRERIAPRDQGTRRRRRARGHDKAALDFHRRANYSAPSTRRFIPRPARPTARSAASSWSGRNLSTTILSHRRTLCSFATSRSGPTDPLHDAHRLEAEMHVLRAAERP